MGKELERDMVEEGVRDGEGERADGGNTRDGGVGCVAKVGLWETDGCG